MAYGALFEGRLGNVLFSDTTPSIVFMGKATKTSNYGTRLSHIGGEYLYMQDWYSGDLTRYSFRKYGVPDDQFKYYWNWRNLASGTTTLGRYDDCRTLEYTVEAYDKPLVFMQFLDPDNYGGLVMKIEDSGSTGTRGYVVWTITVLLYYDTAGTHATAADKIVLYCFSQMDSTYGSTNYGMHIKNIVGSTMYHSDFAPCQIKEMMTITTGTDPSVDFSSTLLDPTGTDFGTISKPCYFSQDWGRLSDYTLMHVGYQGSFIRLETILFPYSIKYVSGDDFSAQFGGNSLFDYVWTSTAKSQEFNGASSVVWAVIDGADYD